MKLIIAITAMSLILLSGCAQTPAAPDISGPTGPPTASPIGQPPISN